MNEADLHLESDSTCSQGGANSPCEEHVEPCEVAMARPPITEEHRLLRQFDRIARLLGDRGMARLAASRVMVIGLGGVGSFAAESLVRTGVGRIDLVDFDDVCVTNTNRQLHALRGNIGRPKVEVMAERMRLIHPRATIVEHKLPYMVDTAESLFAQAPDLILDASDQLTAKCHLIAECRRRGVRLVSSMGAAARFDPTAIRVTDLAFTHTDAMAFHVRKILRQKYGFPPEGQPFGIAAVFSEEHASLPQELAYDKDQGFRCVCPQGENDFLTCERRVRIDGSAAFVTGAFGLAAASVVIRTLTEQPGAFPFATRT